MSFLGVAFLFALPLAVLPVVLHFFDRRRNVQIEWGAMQFLHIAATRETSARRLKEWLLLLCRVAAISALIFALARPLVPGHWFGSTLPSETFLLIDNSLSTSRLADESTQFERMLRQADELIASLPTGDSVRVLVACPTPTWITRGASRLSTETREVIGRQLGELAPTQDDSDLLGALMTAIQVNPDPTFARRQIVLLTDGLAANWDLTDTAGWARLEQAVQETEVATDIRIVGLDSVSIADNVAVTKIECRQTVVGLNQAFSVHARLRNYGPTESSATSASWFVDEKVIQQVSVPAIQPGATQTITWDHSLDTRGAHAVTCRVDAEDVLPGDNDATVVVEAVDRVPILLVEYGEGFTESDQDAYFTQAALGQVPGEAAAARRSVYEPRVISPGQLATIDLDEFRAVVIPSLQECSEIAVRQLTEFVRGGGGLWVSLGPRTDVRWFNERFYGEGDGLSPMKLDRMVETDPDRPPTMINPFLGSHPATVQLVDQDKMDTGDVKVSQRVRFDAQTFTPDVSVLLGLTTGEPLVVERLYERGRVIVQAIPLRAQWSELIQSQAFVVMVQDWLGYLTQPRATRHNLRPGQPIVLRLADTPHATATLTDPTGEQIDLTGQVDGDEVSFHTTRTHAPGMYRLEPGLSGQRIPFYVQRSPRESDLSPLSEDDRAFLRESLVSGKEVAGETADARLGQPIWPLLLIGLLALMAGDLLLSGMISRQRFGVDSVSASPTASSGAAVSAGTGAIGSTPVPGYPLSKQKRKLGRASEERTHDHAEIVRS